MSGATLYLNKIQEVAQVSAGKARQLWEACVWCLTASGHTNGVTMKVHEEDRSDPCIISWPDDEIDLEAVQRSFNQNDATEDGAEAVALLLLIARTEYTAVHRAGETTGIDYWLGYKENIDNPFKQAGRIEISGIFKENEKNTVAARIKEKLKQTRPTAHTFPVYVVVVEFGQPYATIVKNDNLE